VTPRTIEIDGKRYVWRDIVTLRRAQLAAVRQAQQPALFKLTDDRRPASAHGRRPLPRANVVRSVKYARRRRARAPRWPWFSALPVINTLLPSLLRGPALAGGIALYNTMAQFGGFFGPIVIGVLKQETNGYAAGLIALAVAVTLSVVIVALGRALSPRAVSASIVRA
jgi:hypothetical protein